MAYPTELHYTKEHEWVRVERDEGAVGITSHAASELGDIVFVELPDVGETYARGDRFGTIESVKTVADLYMPLSGEIVAVNDGLRDSPETVNEDPYGAGWICRIRITTAGEVEDLISAAEYEASL